MTSERHQRLAAALTIAGSDSSGGAGIQADLKTFAALGIYGASAITALTAQNTTGVQGVQVVPSSFVIAQINSCLADLNIRAIKTGMLATTEIVAAVAERLAEDPDLPVVVDPVMIATSGDALLSPDAVATYISRLIPRATLLTPNLHEAAHLLGRPLAATLDAMAAQAQALRALGAANVLVKGGHGSGTEAVDVLATVSGVRQFLAPRIASQHTHGTGCTLSAAITAQLAQGVPLETAVATAKNYVTEAIRSGASLSVGAGNGPIDHFHRVRSCPPGP